MVTSSARGEPVDFDRMALEVEKLKNEQRNPEAQKVEGSTVEPRIIPRGERGRPVRGFKPEKSMPTQSLGAVSTLTVKTPRQGATKSDNPEKAASDALTDILDGLPESGDLPKESAYEEKTAPKKSPVRKAKK